MMINRQKESRRIIVSNVKNDIRKGHKATPLTELDFYRKLNKIMLILII